MTSRRQVWGRLNVLLAVSVVAGTMAMVSPAAASDRFEDVPSDHTFHNDIAWLAESGITRGCNPPANTRFCPDDEVTRGQMAAFLNRALNLVPAGDQGLTDIAGSTFRADINALAAAEITRGCNPPANTRFCPDDEVTRGQMAAFLRRALELPGNGLIAFDSTRHGGDTDVFVMNPDGTSVKNLTADSTAADFAPAWSPDGRRIAFISTRTGTREIFLMNADGSGVRNLTADLSQTTFESVTFAPGSRIVFSADTPETRNAIWSMNLDGSNLQVFAPTDEPTNHRYHDLEVSRDGQVIGFTAIILGLPGDSFINANVLAYPDSSVDDPRAGPILDDASFFWDFSPDGSKAIFGHPPDVNCGDLELCGALDLFVTDIRSGTAGPFTNLTDTQTVWEDGAEYSPDGTLVAFMRKPDETDNYDIHVMNPNGTAQDNLTNSTSNDRRPAWQPVR